MSDMSEQRVFVIELGDRSSEGFVVEDKTDPVELPAEHNPFSTEALRG